MRAYVFGMFLLTVAGCSGGSGDDDGGIDASSIAIDGGGDAGKADGGGDDPDAGMNDDAGRMADASIDASVQSDAGSSEPDGGMDAGDFDGGPCSPLAADAVAIGMSCEMPLGTPVPSLCPEGYECTPFSGFRLSHECQIPCTRDCECPESSTCGPRCDKTGEPCITVCQPS